TVEPELFASLRPQTYDGNMDDRKVPAAGLPPPAAPMPADAPAIRALGRAAAPAGAAGKGRRDGALQLGILADRAERGEAVDELEAAKQLNLAAGVASAATAQRLGEAFQYRIEHAVNLPRQKSALLPIVQHDVEASRVSVYNPAVHA